ncbi:MAG: type II restriction endonuclease [Bacillota bacterium]
MNENSVWISAVEAVQTSDSSFFKFVTANDSGETGGHQRGFHIPKSAAPVLFNREFSKGEFYEEDIQIIWEDGFVTDSSIKYYGEKTRDEYRLTRFGREFDFRERIATGDVLVISRVEYGVFKAFVLKTEEEIENFVNTFGLSPIDSGSIIEVSQSRIELNEEYEFEHFFQTLGGVFPSTEMMSKTAREIELKINDQEFEILTNPDKKILDWTASEYRLFRFIERGLHLDQVTYGFADIEEFITLANSIMNRRKSRAGKSLEHHLSFIFKENRMQFSEQMVTEENNRPDFIFPSISAYKNVRYPREDIMVLAAKTTCKDRWRQILSETENLDKHYLFTLQQGITINQLDQMYNAKVQLVVPKQHLSTFPEIYRDSILSLKDFIGLVENTYLT